MLVSMRHTDKSEWLKNQVRVPNDLPRLITEEFAAELVTPVGQIITNIVKDGECPRQ